MPWKCETFVKIEKNEFKPIEGTAKIPRLEIVRLASKNSVLQVKLYMCPSVSPSVK